MPFKHRKRYSPTSRQARLLVVQASITAYLQDSPSRFFFLQFAQCEKAKNHTDELRTRATFHMSSTKNSFFRFTSSGVHKQPVLFEVLAHAFFILRGSHVQRQYRKRTTLRSKSSTIKGLLYAPDPHNCKKGTLSDQPQLSCISSTALCAVGDKVAQRYDVLCDWLWDACHMAGVRWRSRCEGFCSEEGPHYRFKQSARKLS
jgi:hypothetical protein